MIKYYTIKDAERLLRYIGKTAKAIGLNINARKAQFIRFDEEAPIRSPNGNEIKQLMDLVYFDCHIHEKKVKQAKTWNKVTFTWKSNFSDNLKLHLFDQFINLHFCMSQHHGQWYQARTTIRHMI